MEIDKSLENFFDVSLAKLREANAESLDTIMRPCPRCHTPMRFPVIARQCDVEAFKELLEIANKYLQERGVTEKMLCALMDQINLGLTIQKALKKESF